MNLPKPPARDRADAPGESQNDRYARRKLHGLIFGQGFDPPHLHHKGTVAMIQIATVPFNFSY